MQHCATATSKLSPSATPDEEMTELVDVMLGGKTAEQVTEDTRRWADRHVFGLTFPE